MLLRNLARPIFVVVLSVCILSLVPQTLAQDKSNEEKLLKKEKKREKMEVKRAKKEEKIRTKEGKKYARLMEFALNLYASDPDFRDLVDEKYLEVQEDHALRAYRINTSRSSEIINVDGGQLKVRRSLYDNPRIQDFVNRIGQGLVPEDSEKLYAFKVIQNPVPTAFTLSTGDLTEILYQSQ